MCDSACVTLRVCVYLCVFVCLGGGGKQSTYNSIEYLIIIRIVSYRIVHKYIITLTLRRSGPEVGPPLQGFIARSHPLPFSSASQNHRTFPVPAHVQDPNCESYHIHQHP